MRRAALALLAAIPFALVASAQSAPSRAQLVAFWSDRGGLPGVWVMRPDGSSRRLLTGSKTRAKRGDFSPDGRRLVFDGQPSSGDVFDFDIQVIGVDGHGRKRLTRGPERDVEPRWSPDGKTIVFQRQLGDLGAPSVWKVSPSGSGLTQLAAGSSPVWTRNGRSILYSRETSAAFGNDIYRMAADGTGSTLFFRSEDDDYPGRYSGDGQRILFTRASRSAPTASIWIMRADGSRAQRLTSVKGYRLAADWSPSGRQILFTRITRVRGSERGQVYVMNVDGTHVRNLSANRFDENAESWWP